MRGQIFIADALVSVLIVTIIIAFTAWEFEQIYNRAPDAEYDKIYLLANDISQMAVKNILANRSFGQTLPNTVNASRWSLLTGNLSQMVLPPYAYEASVSSSTMSVTGNGGCSARQNVAVARRIVYFEASARILTITVCA
jgi:hypothetical protein